MENENKLKKGTAEMQLWHPYSAFSPQITQINTDKIAIPINKMCIRDREEGLSFRNVVIFNLYEYYPLAPNAINSNFNALKEMLIDRVDRCV